MSLTEIIIERIRKEGPLPFRDFMDMALYQPGWGYYTSGKVRIGPEGDYYTTPFLGTLLGDLIAGQLTEFWRVTGGKEFSIVEYGAGNALLCNDILTRLRTNKELYARVRYYIIEKNGAGQRTKSGPHNNIYYCNSVGDIPLTCACILSNELLDNFPVHQVIMEDELKEIFVDYQDGFRELFLPARRELKVYLEELGVRLPVGFRTEINLEAVAWVEEIAAALKRGFVITIDYGHPSAQLYHEQRRSGTLLCYHRHLINSSPYQHIGEQDITAHVNFSALHYWGLKNGLACCGFTTQAQFLRLLGLTEHIRALELSGAYTVTELKQKLFLAHTLLTDLGSKLKVLVQHKGMSVAELQGLRLSSGTYPAEKPLQQY